jgi:hypothetical protein
VLVDDAGAEVLPGARSDSTGSFVLHAARAGTWRVKASRIGYAPVTSDAVTLAVGALAIVRLRMTTLAQQLVPVEVVERRQLNAAELMSASGFDLRERRGVGRFLSGDRLADMGKDGLREILASYFQPALFVVNDAVLGDVLRMRAAGGGTCEPEIYLDGRLLATAPEPGAIIDGPPPVTALDSVRAQGRVEWEQMRLGYGQMYALNLLASLTANVLHGVEVYRPGEVPPPSLGAWFGMTKASVRGCGSIAVWTKNGMRSTVTARAITATGRAVQVVTGTLFDHDTGTPLAGRRVTLLSEGREPVSREVVTDARGDFSVRTSRAGELRLTASSEGYLTTTTPTFLVSANELVVVKLFLSARKGALAPLAVAGRVAPQDLGVASLAGFTYRRERALAGTFYRLAEIVAAKASSISDLVAAASWSAGCKPVYFVDGVRLTAAIDTTLAAIPVSRIFGVEIYTRESEVPGLYAEPGVCGAVVVWTMNGPSRRPPRLGTRD